MYVTVSQSANCLPKRNELRKCVYALFQVSADKEYIRRKIPYTEPKDVDDRTVYVVS